MTRAVIDLAADALAAAGWPAAVVAAAYVAGLLVRVERWHQTTTRAWWWLRTRIGSGDQ
jgi:hypothetical protein